MTIQEYNECIKFRDRLVDLLNRAHTGNDARLIGFQLANKLDKDILDQQQNYSIAGIATNLVFKHSSGQVTLDNWKQANREIRLCINKVNSIGYIPKSAMPEMVGEIEKMIRHLRVLLPVRKKTRTNVNELSGCLYAETRVLVGRSLDKSLETVLVLKEYIEGGYLGQVQLPNDLFEIAIGKNVLEAKIDIKGDIVSIVKISDQPVVTTKDEEDDKFLIRSSVADQSESGIAALRR
jgi:hypothetical protein